MEARHFQYPLLGISNPEALSEVKERKEKEDRRTTSEQLAWRVSIWKGIRREPHHHLGGKKWEFGEKLFQAIFPIEVFKSIYLLLAISFLASAGNNTI